MFAIAYTRYQDSVIKNVGAITAIAHRGASAYAPENTFAAFDLAVEMGIRDIEFDVQFTSDSHIVVIHDEVSDRTTDTTGPVSDMTLEEIQQLDAGSLV